MKTKWLAVLILLLIGQSAFAADGGGQSAEHHSLPFSWGVYIALGVLCLGVIIYASLAIESLGKKVGIFLGMGFLTCVFLATQGEVAHHVLHHVFVVDYFQFIGVPLCTVLIASLMLLSLKDAEFNPGWFMWGTSVLIANLATTWAIVPLALGLIPTLKKHHPKNWIIVLIVYCIFTMNFLAKGTVLADPPQGYWAVQLANQGTPMAFFFPLSVFWFDMIGTWLLYGFVLYRLGVRFGRFSLKALVPPFENWKNVGVAGVIVLAIGISLLFLSGYQITAALGVTFFAFFFYSFKKGHDIKHNTIHWSVETATIFIAFFSVVAFIHTGLQAVEVSDELLVAAVVALTLGADNAAAFAAAYPQYEGREIIQSWYNLYPSISFGGLSPLGNGPQIALFLVILTAKKMVTAGQVFREWFKVAWVFAPYLLCWTLSAIVSIQLTGDFAISKQILCWLVAFGLARIAMNEEQSVFKHGPLHTGLDEQDQPLTEIENMEP